MALCHRIGLTRTQAILIAWLATAIWFGAAHLPTYGWNFAQAFLIIGVARLVLGTPGATKFRNPRQHWHPRISRTPQGSASRIRTRT